ncbi:MAG: HAD family hydrolase [Bacteroidia bacterium]
MVLDYDGTLCSSQDRYNKLSVEIADQLIRILAAGFILGIITGRGKSVRKELQKVIPKKYWRKVIVGYYNGSDIGTLDNESLPVTDSNQNSELLRIHSRLLEHDFISKLKTELRPKQLTIEIANKKDWPKLKGFIQQVVMQLDAVNIQVLESSHSMDIIVRPDVSKLNIFPFCQEMSQKFKISEQSICIGDRGQGPGNDYELLSTKYSLSVDEVSADSNSCWNLSPLGLNGVDSTICYLKRLKFHDKYFTIDYEK